MFRSKKTFVLRKKRKKAKSVGVLCFLVISLCLSVSFLIINKKTTSANADGIAAAPTPEATPPLSKIPPQTQAVRIKIAVGDTRDVFVNAVGIKSVIIAAPEIAFAAIKNGNTLIVTGLKSGETILIISDGQKRQTLIIEVGGKTAASERRNALNAERATDENAAASGSITATYVQGFGGNPSLVRNEVEYRRKLSKNRTLRVSGDVVKSVGGENFNQSLGAVNNFGLNRLAVGVDSPNQTIDFLDSQIQVSALSFNSLPMRGFHLVKTSKSLTRAGTEKKGVEVFAGLARPSFGFDDRENGKIAGAFAPIVNGDRVQIRAGFVAVSAPKNNFGGGRSGAVGQLNASYTPNQNFIASGEAAYGEGGFSWGARLDYKLRHVGASAEIVRFDRDSPLNGIGAQTGGRSSEAAAFYWRPDSRFSFAAQYNRAEFVRPTNSRIGSFNRSSISASFGYRINQNSRLNLRFLDQRIETAIPGGGASKFEIETRSVTAAYNVRFAQNWSNNVEARINFSRESAARAPLENGFNFREQLRYSRRGNSVTGFLNYTYKTPSLTNLIVRNPRLLPPLLQTAFIANPGQFLDLYRDRLGFLLSGIELPLTRNLDAGVRFQTIFSRYTLTGETRYNAGEILSRNEKNLSAYLGVGVRLDSANSFQVSGWKSFGAVGGQSAMTFSYTHRFGAGAGDGFQISQFLGLDKGRVQGRVYFDLNGNGRDDAGEPGVNGATIQLGEKRTIKTDANGRYQLSANEGEYNIALISNDLGVRLRASTATRQQVLLSSSQTATISFGVSDFGFVSGRVFNDLNLTGETSNQNAQGIYGVRIVLRSGDKVIEQTTNGNGIYEFQNLRPGNYTLEVDAATLPANFRLPAQTAREITVEPLGGFYFDVPIAAQRAVAGVVFVDVDGDGEFNPQRDRPVEGAYITGSSSVAVSDRDGSYLLRNLGAGKITLITIDPEGKNRRERVVELGAEPMTKREVNLPLFR